MLWVRISIRARCATLCDKGCHDLRQVGGFPVMFFSKKNILIPNVAEKKFGGGKKII
jgi:hypothetical protein